MSGAATANQLVVWIPILTAFFTAALAAVAFFFQRLLKHSDELIALRRDTYQEYLHSSTAVLSQQMYGADRATRWPVKERLMNARWKLSMIASDRVAELVSENAHLIDGYLEDIAVVQENSLAPDRWSEEEIGQTADDLIKSYAELIRVMRKDCLWKSKMSVDELAINLPFYVTQEV